MKINPSTQCEEIVSECGENSWKYSSFINGAFDVIDHRWRKTLKRVDTDHVELTRRETVEGSAV